MAFDDAVAAMHADEHGRFGIGCVLTSWNGICVLDLDADDDTVGQEVAATAERMVAQRPTYCEASISGRGRHLYYHGTLPHGRSVAELTEAVAIYGKNQFMVVTGNRIATSAPTLGSLQQELDRLPPPVAPSLRTQGMSLDELRMHLIQIEADCDRDEWVQCGMALANETQGADAGFALWDEWSATGGAKYDGTAMLYRQWRGFKLIEGGYRAGTIIHYAKQRRQALPHIQVAPDAFLKRAPAAAAQTATPAMKPAIGRDVLSEVVSHLRQGTAETPPCEQLARLIALNMAGMKVPFYKFAEISTLTTFGGLLGRGYKTIDGLSSAMQQLLVAPTGSGKGEAFSFWPKHIIRAMAGHARTKFFYNGSASSAQGLHREVQHTGTTIWVRPDASADIAILAAPTGPVHTALRDYVYELFDASTYGAPPVCPVASIASAERKDVPIHNATVSMMWSTTPAAFRETYSQSVLSTGLGSRMLITVHDAPAGNSVRDEHVLHNLPGGDNEWLAGIIAACDELDTLHINAPQQAASKIARVPYTANAAELLWQVEQAIDDVRRGVDNKKLPAHYAVFARTAMLTKKIALTCALVRNRFAALIEYEDVAYALGYVLRCLSSLAAMFDKGEVGDADDKAREAAVAGWCRSFATGVKHPRITDKMVDEMVIPLWWFNSRAKNNNVFKKHIKGASEALTKTLGHMCSVGAIEQVAFEGSKGVCFKVIDLEILA